MNIELIIFILFAAALVGVISWLWAMAIDRGGR
jgi:hypothetical protein